MDLAAANAVAEDGQPGAAILGDEDNLPSSQIGTIEEPQLLCILSTRQVVAVFVLPLEACP